MLSHRPRGQALIESAFFLPIMLLALFAVIYFSQAGNLTQRVQIAIRYASLGQWVSGAPPVYSAESIYLSGTQPPGATCPPPPIGVLYNAAPFPGPTSAPFWRPTAVGTATCVQNTLKLGGAQFLMSRYLTSGNATIEASIDVPWYLQSLIGNTATASASENWVHAAWPAAILACIKEANSAVEDMLTNMETVTLPTGWTTTSGC